MTYSTPRSCFSCGTPWSGYGNICNACRTIETINDQARKASERVTNTPAPTIVKVEYVPVSENVRETTYFSNFTSVSDTAVDKSIRRHLKKGKPKPAKIKKNIRARKPRQKRTVLPKTTSTPVSVNIDINYDIIVHIFVGLIALWICSLGNWFIPKCLWILFKVGIWCMGGFFFMDSPFN